MTISSRRKAVMAVGGLALGAVGAACSAPAPTAQPVAQAPAPAQVSSKLFLMVDMVQGSKNIPDAQKAAKSCVLSSKFPRNAEIVWRARVFDPASGELLDKAAMKSVDVKLANGKSIEMQYGPHPKDPPGESFWTGSWLVPKDAPTGTLNYSVLATDTKGRSGEFKPFDSKPSLLTILDEVLADVPVPAPAKK